MIILLSRHVETVENSQNIIQGQSIGGFLSRKGSSQARKLSNSLKEEKIDFIYSSDLNRVVVTSNIIAYFHPKASLIFSKELREIDLGKFEGKTFEDINLSNREVLLSKERGGESIKDVFIRSMDFINDMIDHHLEHTVLLVGHSTIMRALICVMEKKSYDKIPDIPLFDNTSYRIYTYDPSENIFEKKRGDSDSNKEISK